MILFASYLLSASFNPAVDKLEKKISRKIATVIVLALAVIVLMLVLIPAVSIAVKELHNFLINLPSIIKNSTVFLNNFKIGSFVLADFINVESLFNNTTDVSEYFVKNISSFTGAVAQWVTVSIAVIIITFYWVSEKVYVKKQFLMFFPEKYKKKADEISYNISSQIGGYLFAQVSVMFAVGFFTSVGLLLIGVENWFAIGLLTAIFDIVPIVGPILAACIAIFMNINTSALTIVLIIVVFFVAQWLQNAWARPIVYSKFLDVNPVVVVLALLIAAKFLGFWGVLLSPALAAVVCTLVDELYIKQINRIKN